jgi:hypothetical protein
MRVGEKKQMKNRKRMEDESQEINVYKINRWDKNIEIKPRQANEKKIDKQINLILLIFDVLKECIWKVTFCQNHSKSK